MPGALTAVGAFLGTNAGAATIAGVSSVGSSLIKSRAEKKAGEAEIGQSERALDVIGERDTRTQETLAPFIAGETPEQREQQALLGQLGPEEQERAEAALETPTTRALRSQGFRSLDQRFSTAGGLGGSNRINATIAQSADFDRRFSRERQAGLSSLLRDRFNAAQVDAGFGVGAATNEANVIRDIGRTSGDVARDRGAAFQSGVEGLGSIGLSSFEQRRPLKEFSTI